MKNKRFKDSILRKKFFLTVLIIVGINILSLFLLYYIKLKPLFQDQYKIRETIIKEELSLNYQTEEELLQNLDRISKKYDMKFELMDENEKEIIFQNVETTDFFLFNCIVKVDETIYIINGYLQRTWSIASISIGLILYQISIVFVLMILAYSLTGKVIIKPIEKIVRDMKNYKFGKKPVKKEINNELDIIQNEFVDLVDSLEHEKKEQNRIIASISHDIKTPLTSIIGYSDLMNDENLSKEEAIKYSLKIHERALHIKNILGTFDDYLMNYDNKKLKLDTIKIKDIIKDLEEAYRIELENKNISFQIITKCENERIEVDVLKLKRIFSNIISNSIRYVPKEGKIDITIQKENKDMKFTVSDNGTGIDPKLLENIFDPFFTTDRSRKISGLGLSICKEFVEMHGGKIKAKNHNGFIIEFTIPIKSKRK